MAGICLEFAQFGDFDSFDIIRSQASMNGLLDSELPSPIAMGLTTMFYVDSGVIKGQTYYYKARVWRNGDNSVSDEIACMADLLWSPSNLVSTAKLWISSDSVVIDGSNRISQVNDLSTSSFNATQSTNANKPLLIDSDIKFDGIDDYMNFTVPDLFKNVSTAWIFSVFKKNGLDSTDLERPLVCWSNNATAYRVGLTAGNTVSGNKNKICFGGRRLDADAYDGVNSLFEMELNRFYIVVGLIDFINRKIDLFVDGTLVASKTSAFTGSGNTSNTSSSQARFGGNLTSPPGRLGDVSAKQVIASNTPLTTADRQKIEGWAAHKYGLTNNLQIDHPYKTLQPTLD